LCSDLTKGVQRQKQCPGKLWEGLTYQEVLLEGSLPEKGRASGGFKEKSNPKKEQTMVIVMGDFLGVSA